MQWETLESRTLLHTPIDTSTVSLEDANGNPTTLNRHLAQVILVHGATMNGSEMVDFAHAVQAQLPANQYQIVILDWGYLATSAPYNVERSALAVGTAVASMIQAARVPASRVNLVGYSLGGTVIGRLALDLKTKTTQVNTIIGIDPAAGRYEAPNYAQDSRYSFSFCGHDADAHDLASLSGDDAIVLTGLPGDALLQHQSVFTVVTTMWQRDAGTLSAGDDHISSLFSVPALLNGSPFPWRHGTYDGGFEALMPVGYEPTDSADLGPLSLTYFNTRGHKVTLS